MSLAVTIGKVLGADPVCRARFLEEMVRWHRLRSAVIPEAAGSDPGWSILLQVRLAEMRQVDLSVTELASAHRVSWPTPWRAFEKLVDARLLVSTPDPKDARRSLVTMSPAGRDKVDRLLFEAGPWVRG